MINRFNIGLGVLFFSACSPIQQDRYSGQSLHADVSSALNAMKLYRNNPNNEGGNENMIFEPSTYFDPSEKPTWMKSENNSYMFIVALIACDREFGQSNWNAFFHGIGSEKRDLIRNKVYSLKEGEYIDICTSSGADSFLPYFEFKFKINGFINRRFQIVSE